jgi:hypothetical protein
MPKKSRLVDQTQGFVAAVLQVNRDEIATALGEAGNSTPHLVSANPALAELVKNALDTNPHSALGKYLSDMIDRHALFEMIGPWPPKHNPDPKSASPMACPHCGKLIL